MKPQRAHVVNVRRVESELSYKHRPYMNGGKFKAKGIDYEIVEGTWICRNNQVLDAVRFKNIKTGQKTVMPEEEFFSKINIDNIKLK